MSLRNRNPSEPRRSDQPIKRVISQFNGMISGEPQTKIPAQFSQKNTNVIDRGGYCDIRGGSNKYAGQVISGVSYSTGIVTLIKEDYYPLEIFPVVYDYTGFGFRFYGENIPYLNGGVRVNTNTVYYGKYYLGDNEFDVYTTKEYALAGGETGKVYFDPDIPVSRTCYIAFEHTYIFDHVKAGKLIFINGNDVYVINKNMDDLSTPFFTPKALKYGLHSSYTYDEEDQLFDVSSIVAYGNNAIITSLIGGIWKLILDDPQHYYLYKINSDSPAKVIADINYSVSLTFGYLYTHTLCKITGTGNIDRLSDGAVLQYETGTCQEAGKEKDYGEVYFNTAVGINLATSHIVPAMIIDGKKTIGMTHIGLYRTKDIGAIGTALGNRRDELIWVADIPICKPMMVDTSTPGHIKVVSGIEFVLGDVGSTIHVNSNGSYGFTVITSFVSGTDVTVSGGSILPVSSKCSACIGSAKFGRALSQSKITESGTILNVIRISRDEQESYVASKDRLGLMAFLSDGTTRHIKYCDTQQHDPLDEDGYTVDIMIVCEDGDFTDLVIAIVSPDSVTPKNQRLWNDTIPDSPQADGRVSLQDRIEYGTDLYIPRRFFIPLPNCDIMHMSNGFLVTAVRNGSQYDYCQAGDKEYSIGHYKYPEQSRRVTGSIQQIVGMGDRAVILMKNKTGIITLSSSQNIGRTEVGENIYQLPEMGIVDDNKGVIAWKLITLKNSNIIFALTSDGALRYFDGSAWSQQDYGFVNGLDAVSKEYLKRIDHSQAYGANYNQAGGLKIWAKRLVGGILEDICLRFSTESNEGHGWTIIEGTDWVSPMESFGVFTILDDNGVQRCLAIDKNDHYIYEIDTFDRTTRERKYVLDKTGVNNTEVAWSKKTREEVVDIGSQNKKLKHERSYVHIAPEYSEDRGETGYTATGIRNAQELTLKAFEDGEQVTASAETVDFPEDGELSYSGRKVEASRISTELSGTAGEIRITGIVNEFLAENRGPVADKRLLTEHGYEKELSTGLLYHLSRGNVERVSGVDIGEGVSFITGPDDREKSGMTLSNDLIIPAPTSSDKTFIVWSKESDIVKEFKTLIECSMDIYTGTYDFTYYESEIFAVIQGILGNPIYDGRTILDSEWIQAVDDYMVSQYPAIPVFSTCLLSYTKRKDGVIYSNPTSWIFGLTEASTFTSLDSTLVFTT